MTAPIFASAELLAQNVQPKATTPGVAQDSNPSSGGAGSPPGGGSPLAGFMPILMMLVIFVPFFFLMSRRQKKESAARSALKKGDKIVTNAGLIGELVSTDERIAKVKLAPGLTVEVVANTISPFATEPEKTGAGKDLKEASEKK